MSVTWKINGTPVETLGVEKVALELVNQQPDKLNFALRNVEFDTNADYSTAPDVTLEGGGGTGATAHATVADGVLSALVLDSGGSGYTSAPNVVFSGGGSFGASAIAQLTPTTVASGTLVNGGAGYSSAPAVGVTGGGGSGATFTTTLAARAVASLTLIAGGSGYTTVPSVSITGGGGAGATATATLSAGSVISVTLSNNGTGYTTPPTISFTGGGGSGAEAVANLTATSIASAALTSAGSGYTVAPTITVSGGSGSGAAVSATLAGAALQSIAITSGGSGYASAPTVSITGGGGTGATAVATLSGSSVVSITVTNGGSGYRSIPFVSLSGGGGSLANASAILTPTGVSYVWPNNETDAHGWATTPTVSFTGGGGGSGAAATVTVDGIVRSLSLTNFGSGYTSRPTVTLTGGGGSGAEAWCELTTDGKVGQITLLRHGSGYTSAPTVVFSGGGGSGAAATATQSNAIVDVTVTNPGSGYTTPPFVTFSAVGKSASGTSLLVGTSIASFSMVNNGYGYTSPPSVSINGGSHLGPPAYAKFSGAGVLTDVVLLDVFNRIPVKLGGRFYSAPPTITIYAPSGFGSGATATATLSGDSVDAITVTNGGTGYTRPGNSSATVGQAAGGTGATATANLSAAVTSVTLTNGGSGYTSAPSISFTGGGGSGAAATAALAPTSLASLTVTNGGTGYTSAPTLSIPAGTAPGGTAATGDTALTGTSLASVTVTAGGDNYATAPSVSFTGGGGTGAAATSAVSRTVAALTLTAPGGGFTSVPSLSITGGGGSGATGAVVLTTAAVASLTMTNPGSGYTSRPSLTIIGGGGAGAAASAVLAGTSVGALILQSNGGVLPFDAAIVLSREESGVEETWFQGVIRETPRTRSSRQNQIGYVAFGPWQWLERIPYLQTFQQAVDPSSPTSELTGYQRGRVVLAQDDNGLKISLGAFLEAVIDYAISSKPGVMQRGSFAALNVTIPWDEVVDLSCAETITRALSVLPDVVCSWNYNVSPPLLSIERRSALPAIDFVVQPQGAADDSGYVPAESIDLRERNDLRKTGVYLLYLATNRSNGAAWETATADVYPPGTVANSPNTLFRTIQLAGSMAQSTELTQKVDVDPLTSALDYDSTTFLSSGDQFNSLRSWWYNHAPELQSSYIVIKGFVKCSRAGTNVATLNKELVAGAITDWMEDNQNIAQEQQTVTAFICYEETLPTDSTKKARHFKKFVAPVTATNAQTRTYRFTAEASYTPPEEVPVGLAQAIYESISLPQYDGSITLLEREATRRQLVGCVLNLQNSLGDWSTMNALIQRAKIDIDKGATQIVVGPPRQVSPDTLAELYRANRNRQPVTSYLVRTSGVTGTAGGSQGLGRHHRGGARASGIAQAPGRYTQSLSVAGAVPTNSEISAALAATYAGDAIPTEGDTVSLTVSSTVKFQAIVTMTAIAPESWRRVSWTWSGQTFYAWVQQIGLY